MRDPKGCLVAVVGPSGAGKDTVLAAVAARTGGAHDIMFVRRVITRTEGPGEDNEAMTPDAFRAADATGQFCLSWSAHDLSYALPASALAHTLAGGIAVANLSRRALAPASKLFPCLAVIEITAPGDILRARLLARGRETEEQVDARLARAVPLDVPASARLHVRIDNSGPLAAGVDRFVDALTLLRQPETI
ncbi:phosphonate metabolism protein/1,5-bisphosphokinase (PRPP-forming) PhnN [Aureimonas sp. OT7]|uniref:phosphonate metabolism protein/1,5-bisphosphokinase (PRPP-forming) PhnN n=1 Tax=Aureimonas sp. OT7 TaxID=2816454 RepID=UPI00177F9A48|nr:phosphonate metabolism protein/1,5-bisphosphokinase (PRPP-forming) PhnN [Aureimonas sp. OT7]QOG05260.1 phosphonate metabolism protein/1,5-bisphosphokinase (PRPP-forming) PhnN [Aureimonas sp. OT7]